MWCKTILPFRVMAFDTHKSEKLQNDIHECIHIGFAYTMRSMSMYICMCIPFFACHKSKHVHAFAIGMYKVFDFVAFTFDLFHCWMVCIRNVDMYMLGRSIVAKYYLIRNSMVRQHYANAKFNANIGYVDDVLFLAVIATHHQYSLWYFVWRLFAIEMSCE